MFFLSENLCMNIVYPDVHAKILFQIFWYFKICFLIMSSFALVSQNEYPQEKPLIWARKRFGDVAVLKLFSVLHRKISYKFSVYLLDLRFLVHMPQVISKLLLVEHFLIWATENLSKIRPLSAVLFWQISANICFCHFIGFFSSSFDHGTLVEVATVVFTLYVVFLSWNLKQKEVNYMLCLH
jgi:hypothetical protein